MKIVTVRCLKDNLSYLVVDEASGTCVAIDPGEAAPFIEALQSGGWTLCAVFATHHHPDHINGIPSLPLAPSYCSQRDRDRIPATYADQGPKLVYNTFTNYSWHDLTGQAANIHFRCIEIPGHTEGQHGLIFESANIECNPALNGTSESHLFVGDTLFSFGCGRCLEGTPEILFQSLQKIKRLDPATRLHFGHEYTKTNANFWLSTAALNQPDHLSLVDPSAIAKTLNAVTVGAGFRSPPPTLGDELDLNPFLKIKNATDFRRWRSLRDSF